MERPCRWGLSRQGLGSSTGAAVIAALNSAVAYARRRWPVLPFRMSDGRKMPLTEHGVHDATLDEDQIAAWWKRWPDALVAIATGKPSGIVALDIDIRKTGSGLDSLQMLGVNFHPQTPSAHTPSGGLHCLFAWPGHHVPCSAGKLGPHLDVRGDGGALILPPGPGRFWDPHLGLDTPLMPVPAWMTPPEPERIARVPRIKTTLTPYCEAALRNTYQRIVEAPCGQQETTLNNAAFALGGLIASRGMPADAALELLQLAASKMPIYDTSRPWRQKELDRKIRDALTDGLRRGTQDV